MKKWEPIINERELVICAKDRIKNIYQSIKENILDEKSVFDKENVSFYSGMQGICMFLYYYALAFDRNDKLWKKTYYDINEKVSNLTLDNKLFFVYNMNFILFSFFLNKNTAIKVDDSGFFVENDDILEQLMFSFIEDKNYDLVYGATQIATYFLWQYPNNNNLYKAYLDKYLVLLYEHADKIDWDKLAWRYQLISDEKVEMYNLGLAHGIPVLIMFFAKLKKHKISHPLLDILLNKSINYILSTEQDIKTFGSHFCMNIPVDTKINEFSRIGWCYGDLGIGYALLHAAEYVDKPQILKAKSYEILHDALIRKDEKETMIKDCCLCHGTSGIAIMYDMLYKKTKNEKFKEIAYYWYKKTIMEPYEYEYDGGYKIHAGTSSSYISDISFLSGISGIGLSLMASIYPIYPDWVEFLLLK